MKKRSLRAVNEHSDLVFNAAATTQIVFHSFPGAQLRVLLQRFHFEQTYPPPHAGNANAHSDKIVCQQTKVFGAGRQGVVVAERLSWLANQYELGFLLARARFSAKLVCESPRLYRRAFFQRRFW